MLRQWLGVPTGRQVGPVPAGSPHPWAAISIRHCTYCTLVPRVTVQDVEEQL